MAGLDDSDEFSPLLPAPSVPSLEKRLEERFARMEVKLEEQQQQQQQQ